MYLLTFLSLGKIITSHMLLFLSHFKMNYERSVYIQKVVQGVRENVIERYDKITYLGANFEDLL